MTRRLTTIPPAWNLPRLQEHLQGAVDLELWTIPYYLTMLYSIKDPTADAYRLIQAVVYQEMLHVQLVANIANAFGYSPEFRAPVYKGKNIPHIDFDLDTPNPTQQYSPYSAELGPLDDVRLNTTCLIEYPEWLTEREPDVSETQQEYGSIGEFYDAVRVGMRQLRAQVRGNVNQVDEFGPFYNNQPDLTITLDGDDGYRQAMTLVDIIVDQGEGQTEAVESVPTEFQNTADGFQSASTHFQKFESIRNSKCRPATYTGVAKPDRGSPGAAAQKILAADFAEFLKILTRMFNGKPTPPAFGSLMAKLGGDVLTCWQRNAIPRFSED